MIATPTRRPRARINAEAAAIILERWDAVQRRLQKPSAWITLLRLAAADGWISVTDLSNRGGHDARKTVTSLLRSWHAAGLVERETREDPRICKGSFSVYRITAAGLQLLNSH